METLSNDAASKQPLQYQIEQQQQRRYVHALVGKEGEEKWVNRP